MEPITLLALAGLAYVVLGSKKKKTRHPMDLGDYKGAEAPPPEARIQIAADCSSWKLPWEWWETAQKRWEAYLVQQWTDPSADPPENLNMITKYLLVTKDIGSKCPLPPDATSQTDVPNVPNYWGGPPAMLELFKYVYPYVVEAAARYRGSGGGDIRLITEASKASYP